MNIRRTLTFIAGLGFLAATGFGPAPDASAQASSQPCQTCDTLNSRPGGGGPGFSDFQFWCVEGGAGEVTVRVGTRGQAGLWTAGFGAKGHVVETTFKGSTNLVATGIAHGTVITRWLRDPAGRYVIAPRDEIFECGDCEQPPATTSTTVPQPPSTVPGTPTTPPVRVPGTPPNTLPATGSDTLSGPLPWIAGTAILAGVILAAIARRSDDAEAN